MTRPQIEADRIHLFGELLYLRSQLLYAQINLETARARKTSLVDLYYVTMYLDEVWDAQQNCIRFEIEHPMERRDA